MKKDIVLQVDPNFNYSINTQIKEQLKWLIGIGLIQAGELLPPAGQLADRLNVNRNTVTLVYTQLRDEGIVSIKKGRGTQVLDGPIFDELRNKRKSMYELLARTMGEAVEEGIDLYEMLLASFAFVQLFNQVSTKKLRILFIECRGHDYPYYRLQVERAMNAEVATLFLEEITSNPNLLFEGAAGADMIVTTLNHHDEVNELLSGRPIQLLTIAASADMATLMDISKIKAGNKVAFVCLGKQGGQWMAERVKEAGIDHIESIAVGVDEKDALDKAIAQSTHVYASSAVLDMVKALAPAKAAFYPMIMEKSSEQLLKKAADG